MGVITVALSFSLVSGKKISLMQRSTMQEAIGATQVGGIVRLTSFVIHTIFYLSVLLHEYYEINFLKLVPKSIQVKFLKQTNLNQTQHLFV